MRWLLGVFILVVFIQIALELNHLRERQLEEAEKCRLYGGPHELYRENCHKSSQEPFYAKIDGPTLIDEAVRHVIAYHWSIPLLVLISLAYWIQSAYYWFRHGYYVACKIYYS